MAIAYDNGTVVQVNNVSSRTFSHTVSGGNRVLFVGAVGSGGSSVPTGITYNGVAMTKIRDDIPTGNAVTSSLWYLVAPATGANDVIVSYGTSIFGATGAISLTGVQQSSTLDGNNGDNGSGTSSTNSITTTVANDWLVDLIGILSTATLTPGGSQTKRLDQVGGVNFSQMAMSTRTAPTATSTATSWTIGSSTDYGHSSVAVKAAIAPSITF